MHFEFQSKIYASAAEMHHAIAEAHLDDDGHKDLAEELAYLALHTDAECADEAIKQWLLDEKAWAEPRAFSRADLIKAYENLRRNKLSAEIYYRQFVSTPLFATAPGL